MKVAVELGRFFLTAAAVSMAMPLLYIGFGAFEQGKIMFGLYGIGLIVAFPLTVFCGVIFGLPTWYLAHKMGWTDKLVSMIVLGGASGMLAVTAVLFGTGPVGDTFPFVAGALFGIPAGALSAWIWFVLHADDRSGVSG